MRLTNYIIARRNITRCPLRNFCLISAEIILAAFLFAGTVLIMSLSNGAQSMSDRLGADIMLVPSGYDPHIDNILLSGKPSAFYLPDNALELVNNLDPEIKSRIEKFSPQVFMATLRASCCAYPVQIMGIDYNSDFIIKPWLNQTLKRELNDGEIILGFHNVGEVGDNITFFGEDLRIAGKLERTGMGFDSSVFMNRSTIIKLANAADKIKSQKLAANNNLVSVIMIKLKPGQDSAETSRKINRELNKSGIYALFSKKFVNHISSSLVLISGIIKYFLVILWLMAIIIIALLFSLTINERKQEFAILRAIGASRKKLSAMILYEASLIGLYGVITGIIFGAIIIFAASPFISELLNLPFLMPSPEKLLFIAALSGIITLLTDLIITGIFAIRAGRADIHENLR
ncbi:MAG: ABC transporter permease [Synergistaceae bacterium]|nr:ABC transporter permease [Synergistaceae bacterium]